MIVEESEFIYILNGYHGNARNFAAYFKEAYYRLQKERAVTISAYMMLKNFTGVTIPKLEEFLKINEDDGEQVTVEDIKEEITSGGGIVIEGK